MPQVAITLRTLDTWRSSTARTPVAGLTPLLARVAPIIARSRQVTSMAALVEVEVQHPLGVVADHREVAQQMGDRAVAVPGVALGAVHLLVHPQLAPGVAAEGGEDALELGGRRARAAGRSWRWPRR